MIKFHPAPSEAIYSGNGAVVTFEELERLVQEQIPVLRSFGPRVLALSVTNAFEDIVISLAALRAGLPLALLNGQLAGEALERVLKLLPESVLVKQRTYFEGAGTRLHPRAALILFTSGSSGETKAVQLSEQNILANTNAVARALEFSEIQRQHLFLPLSYSFGFLGQLLPALQQGKPSHLYQDFSAFVRSLVEQSPSGMISGVPSHFEALLRTMRAPNSEITHVVSAGAKLTPDLRGRLVAAFPGALVSSNYGQTEASPRILSFDSRDPLFTQDFTGRPVGDWELRLSAEGELQCRGPQVMLGYLNASTTDQTLREGWLCTGDRAEIAPDGLVRVLGRKDDLVKVSGERVSLSRLEERYKNILGHDEVVVLAQEDSLRGMQIVLLVVGAAGSEAAVRKLLAEKCLLAEIPQRLLVIDSIPRLSSGKVDKASLAKFLN